MPNVLTRKLDSLLPLSIAEKRTLDALIRSPRRIGRGADIIAEGQKPTHVRLVLDGFACRYKMLPDGKRHIAALLVPGDFCDLHVFLLDQMDHSMGALSECTVVDIPEAAIMDLLLNHRAIAPALFMATLVDEATLREWLANMAGRPAVKRIGHLLCELLARLEAVGLAGGSRFELPLTQTDIADTAGMSVVHANRSLQVLRRAGLITAKASEIVVEDRAALEDFSEFDSRYLHLRARFLEARRARSR